MQKNDKKKAALSEYREALKELEYWVDTLARMDHGGQQAQTFTARIRESTKARSPEMKTIERSMAEENKRLKAQMEMQAQNITFLENCLLEMGDIVYA